MKARGGFDARVRLLGPCLVVLAAMTPMASGATPAAPKDADADADAGYTGELDLVLHGALLRDPADPESARNLWLHLEAERGAWRRVWGKAQSFTVGEHLGIVERAEVTGSTIRLAVSLLVRGDFWVKGTWHAAQEIVLRRGPGGTLAGEFSGTFDGASVRGRVEGREPPARPVRAGFVPPAPDEHPRLLFRRADIPRLRAKLATPLGRAYRERAESSGSLIHLGVLYRLSGDSAWADRARDVFLARYGEGIPVFGFGSGGFGHEVFRAALAYDLCYDAWPEDLRARVHDELREFTLRHQFVLMTSHANFHPASNYYGPGRGVPGIVSLAIRGAKGEEPARPRGPLDRLWELRPPEGFTPGRGVEAQDLRLGACPTRWIWTGPLPHASSRDVLHSLGGYASARPDLDSQGSMTVKTATWFRKMPFTFRPLPAGAASAEGIDLDRAVVAKEPAVIVLFTALRVGRTVVVGLPERLDETRVWLSGAELDPRRFYRLHAGVHPVTIEHRSERPTGVIGPRLSDPADPALQRVLGVHRIEAALWKEDHAVWASRGVDPVLELLVDRGWWQNFQHYRWGIGDGGFQAETGGYADIASWYPSLYAAFYPNVCGRAVSPYPDVSHVVPRRMMQSVFLPDGQARAMKLSSATGLDPRWIAAHFPTIPERYRRSVLWAWNRILGVTDASTTPRLLGREPGATGRGPGPRLPELGEITLAQTFVRYPLDAEPLSPSEGMPRTWRADTFGLHVFRSGWQEGEECVAQVFLKASPVVGWSHPNAGGFQLWGLGHAWTTSPATRNGVRAQESVVLLPDDDIHRGSCGRLLHREVSPDGSGSLTFSLDDVYAAPSPGLHDRMLIRDETKRKPSGITGLRALAFDYSGRSGAPCLMVMVDRIRGGGRKLWTWQRPSAEARVDGSAFTLSHPDASLRATFIAPEDVRVETRDERVEEGTARKGFHGMLRRVVATGGDDYLVVITLQRGDPPEVEVEGTGLGARITVGAQTIRFDGERIRIGAATAGGSDAGGSDVGVDVDDGRNTTDGTDSTQEGP